MLLPLVILSAAQWFYAPPPTAAPRRGLPGQRFLGAAVWGGSPPAPARGPALRAWRGVTATLEVARVAARGLPLGEAEACLGGVAPATLGLCRYLQHPDSPVVLVYAADGTYLRPAPLGYYWRETGHAETARSLQGTWRIWGVCATDGVWPNTAFVRAPFAFAVVQGDAAEFMTLAGPVTMIYEARVSGGRTRLVANIPDPAEREVMAKIACIVTAERTLVWVGPALLTFTAGPGWLELSVWTRPGH